MTKILNVVKVILIVAIMYLVVEPYYVQFVDNKMSLENAVQLSQTLNSQIAPLAEELNSLKETFSNQNLKTYNSNFEVADFIDSIPGTKIKSITGIRDVDGVSEEIITVNSITDVEYFTDMITEIRYVLKYKSIRDVVKACQDAAIPMESFEIDRKAKTVVLVVTAINSSNTPIDLSEIEPETSSEISLITDVNTGTEELQSMNKEEEKELPVKETNAVVDNEEEAKDLW